MRKFQAINSECVWHFDWKDGLIHVYVDTKQNIIYSEYAFYGGLELAVILDEETYLWLDTTKNPNLSRDKKVFYYYGKVLWTVKCPEFFNDGILSFKECTPIGRCNKMRYTRFNHTSSGWRFWNTPAPFVDENEKRIPDFEE